MLLARTMIAIALSTTIVCALADELQDASAAIHRKDYPAAVRLLEPLARRGDALAQLRLGLLYYHGHGVRESDAQAVLWFERAARQGLADAQFHLGNMYAYGLAPLPADTDGNPAVQLLKMIPDPEFLPGNPETDQQDIGSGIILSS